MSVGDAEVSGSPIIVGSCFLTGVSTSWLRVSEGVGLLWFIMKFVMCCAQRGADCVFDVVVIMYWALCECRLLCRTQTLYSNRSMNAPAAV